MITADLGDPQAAQALWTAATRTPVDILINNAGFGYFRPFGSVEWARDAELLQLNITSLVQLSRLFVDHRRGRTERGYRVNIASIGAYQSVPNMALYASSKAFVRNFTEALHDELRDMPVSATCVSPGGTKTNFHAMAGAGDYGWIANRSMMTAEQVAAITVRAMLAGKRNVIPGLVNKLSCWGVRFVPRWFASWHHVAKSARHTSPGRIARTHHGEGRMTEPHNTRHWNDTQRGVYEVWYMTWNHPATHQGFWLRYITEAAVDGAPRAELWFARFDSANPARTFGIHKRFTHAQLTSTASPFTLEIAGSRLGHDHAIGQLKRSSNNTNRPCPRRMVASQPRPQPNPVAHGTLSISGCSSMRNDSHNEEPIDFDYFLI